MKASALRLVLFLTASGTTTVLPVNAGSRMIVVPDDCSIIASAVAVAACAGLHLYLRRRKRQASEMSQNE